MDSLGMDPGDMVRVGIRKVSMLIRGGGEGPVRGCWEGVWLRWLVVVVWTFCFRVDKPAMDGWGSMKMDGKHLGRRSGMVAGLRVEDVGGISLLIRRQEDASTLHSRSRREEVWFLCISEERRGARFDWGGKKA